MIGRRKNIVETYRGSQAVAQKKYLKDRPKKAKRGYHPVSESWEPGSYGCGAFLLALLLCLVLIGVLVFIYMLIVKPPGTLTVTYEHRDGEPSVSEGKTCPKCAEQVKIAATVCRFCGYEFS